LPLQLLLPELVPLPLGLLLIWQIRQISRGAPTRWPLLVFLARALFIITAYLYAFTLWTG
jgi:hypothetical protein